MENFEKLKKLLTEPKKVLITMHQRPDADALGSSLALMHFLKQLGHEVQVIAPTDYPHFLKWLPGNEDVMIFSAKNATEVKRRILDSDFVFCLDFNALKRIGEMGAIVKESKAQKVLVDHHLEPEAFYDFAHWNSDASSTAELIYEFVGFWKEEASFSIGMAECIYAGIMTDTGSFRFPSTSAKVHRILADLIDLGIDHSRIHRKIYDENSADRMRLMGYTLSEKLEVFPDIHAAVMTLSQKELDDFHFSPGDTEGLVNYALSIRGIILAIIVMEKDDMVKMSFRSVGDFNVNQFARTHFHGGGHKNAAGGISELSFLETVEKIRTLLPTYAEDLKESFDQLD